MAPKKMKKYAGPIDDGEMLRDLYHEAAEKGMEDDLSDSSGEDPDEHTVCRVARHNQKETFCCLFCCCFILALMIMCLVNAGTSVVTTTEVPKQALPEFINPPTAPPTGTANEAVSTPCSKAVKACRMMTACWMSLSSINENSTDFDKLNAVLNPCYNKTALSLGLDVIVECSGTSRSLIKTMSRDAKESLRTCVSSHEEENMCLFTRKVEAEAQLLLGSTPEATKFNCPGVAGLGPETPKPVYCPTGTCVAPKSIPKLVPPAKTRCQSDPCTFQECCRKAGECSAQFATEKCPDDRYLVKGIKYCSGMECTVDECCNFKPKCKPDICLDPYIVMSKFPAHCAGKKCEKEDCCQHRASCTTIKNCGFGKVKKLDENQQQLMCQGLSCRDSECCDVAGQCTSSVCVAAEGRVLKADAPEFCPTAASKGGCADDVCCENAGKCEVFACSEGWTEKQNGQFCSTITCSQGECCEPSDQCTSAKCTGINVLKATPPTFCVGITCAETECCEEADTCAISAASLCTQGFVPKDQPTDFCATSQCKQQECCQAAPRCMPGVCAAASPPMTFVLTESKFCKGTTCIAEECCSPRAQCSTSEITCADGMVKDASKGADSFCKSTDCLSDECCAPKGRCVQTDCNSEQFYKPAGDYCNGIKCDNNECCGQRAQCEASFCVAGYALNQDTSLCARDTCIVDECCYPLGVCKASVCSGDHVLLKKLPNFCEGGQCRDDECCAAKQKCQQFFDKEVDSTGQQSTGCAKPTQVVTSDTIDNTICVGNPCTEKECCFQKGVCIRSICTQTMTLKEGVSLCEGEICTAPECCESLQQCSEASATLCTNGFAVNGGVANNYCKTKTCTVSECCTPQQSCKTVCDEGTENANGNEQYVVKAATCEGNACTLASCCEAKTKCGDVDVCGDSHYANASHPIFCDGASCAVEECCIAKQICDSKVCSAEQPDGKALTLNPPTYCNTDTCGVECCVTPQSCALSGFDCSTPYVKKATWADASCVDRPGGECTVEDCCDIKGQCGECPTNYMKKVSASDFCEKAQCRNDECCEPKPKCESFQCVSGYVLKSSPPERCDKRECSLAECCVPKAMCSSSDCTLPKMFFSGSNKMCVGATCDPNNECCSYRGECQTATPATQCPESQVPKVDASPYCDDSVCTLAECCDPKDVCTEAFCQQKSSAAKSSRVLRPGTVSFYCEGTICGEEECCVATCEDFTCSSSEVPKISLNPKLSPLACQGLECTAQECCLPRATCGLPTCGADFLSAAAEVQCQGATCTFDECCTLKGKCDVSLCNEGYILKKNPSLCEGSTCQRLECCSEQDKCRAEVCGVSQVLLAVPPKFCRSTTCEESECCQARGECTKSICADAGSKWMLKEAGFFPLYCHGAACSESECCQERGNCGCGSPFPCTKGFMLKPDVCSPKPDYTPKFWCDDVECTHDECCVSSCEVAKNQCHEDANCKFAWANTEDQPSFAVMSESLFTPCGSCSDGYPASCHDKKALLLLWNVAIQCPNELFPDKCLPNENLQMYWTTLSAIAASELCSMIPDMQDAMTGDWVINGCSSPLQSTTEPTPKLPQKPLALIIHKTTTTVPPTPCEKAEQMCIKNEQCRTQFEASKTAERNSDKVIDALTMCPNPFSMLLLIGLYQECPGLVGGEKKCYTLMAGVLQSKFLEGDVKPCDKRYLPKTRDVRKCFGDPQIDEPTGCVAKNECQKAICACQANSRCKMDFSAGLEMDSYGKMEICLSSCDDFTALDLFLTVYNTCRSYLPCGDRDACMPCEVMVEMQEAIREMPPDYLCDYTPQFTEGMITQMQVRKCDPTPPGVFDGSSRRLSAQETPNGNSTEFVPPKWLQDIRQSVHTRFKVV